MNVKMDEDTFDLSHLTARERERILAVINADQELRIQRLRYISLATAETHTAVAFASNKSCHGCT